MISERTLRKWRKESLLNTDPNMDLYATNDGMKTKDEYVKALHRKILSMTQELLDQYLLKK